MRRSISPMEPEKEKRMARARPTKEDRKKSWLAKLDTPEKIREAIKASAARMIAAKDWPEKGLVDRLEEKFKGVPAAREAAEAVVSGLAAKGIVDDARFARGFLRARISRKAKKLALRELMGKGVGEEAALLAMEELEEEFAQQGEGGLSSDEKAIENAWKSKFRGRIPADEKEKMRQWRFLASRGFSLGDIQKLWKRAERGELEDQAPG